MGKKSLAMISQEGSLFLFVYMKPTNEASIVLLFAYFDVGEVS